MCHHLQICQDFLNTFEHGPYDFFGKFPNGILTFSAWYRYERDVRGLLLILCQVREFSHLLFNDKYTMDRLYEILELFLY